MTLRQLAGYTLFAIATAAWLAVPVIPFLDWTLGTIAAVTTTLIIVGEGAFYLAILVLGKEIWLKLKATVLNPQWLKAWLDRTR